MTILKRCPRCGGKGKVKKSIISLNGRRATRIKCTDCGFMTTEWGSKEEAVREWNGYKNTMMDGKGEGE